MACGENPKRVYGGRTQAPSTRMGNVAAYRSAWIRAQRYQADWDRYNQAVKDAAGKLRAIAVAPRWHRRYSPIHHHGATSNWIRWPAHCAATFSYTCTATAPMKCSPSSTARIWLPRWHLSSWRRGHKIADELAENGVCGALWADWWGFKIEAYDGIQENIMVDRPANGCAIVLGLDEGINASIGKPQRPCYEATVPGWIFRRARHSMDYL